MSRKDLPFLRIGLIAFLSFPNFLQMPGMAFEVCENKPVLFEERVGVTSQPSVPLHCGSLCPKTPQPSPSRGIRECFCISHPHLREMPSGTFFRREASGSDWSHTRTSLTEFTVSPLRPTLKALLRLHAVPRMSGKFNVFFQNVAPSGTTGWPLHTALVIGLILLLWARPALRPRVLICLISLFFSKYSGLHIL